MTIYGLKSPATPCLGLGCFGSDESPVSIEEHYAVVARTNDVFGHHVVEGRKTESNRPRPRLLWS